MQHLKLVHDDPWVSVKLKLTSEEVQVFENFKKEDLVLFKEIQECASFFLDNKLTSSKTHKFFLIFAYNYFSLSMRSLALDMLSYINLSYFEDHFISDLEFAVTKRNEAEEFERKREIEKARACWKEAEFFLVGTKILPFLAKIDYINSSNEYKKFLMKVKEKPFIIKFAPMLELVN